MTRTYLTINNDHFSGTQKHAVAFMLANAQCWTENGGMRALKNKPSDLKLAGANHFAFQDSGDTSWLDWVCSSYAALTGNDHPNMPIDNSDEVVALYLYPYHYSITYHSLVVWLTEAYNGVDGMHAPAGGHRISEDEAGTLTEYSAPEVEYLHNDMRDWIIATYTEITGKDIEDFSWTGECVENVQPPTPTPAPTQPTGFNLEAARQQHEEAVAAQRAFTPSVYQQAIFDWVRDGEGNGFCDAVAGSGKTTTLIQAAKQVEENGLCLVFSKRVQEENVPKFSGTTFRVQTCHSLGFQAVRQVYPRTKLNAKKYRNMVYALLNQAVDTGCIGGRRIEDWTLGALEEIYPARELTKLVDLCRATLTQTGPHNDDIDRVLAVAAHYSVEIPPSISRFCARAVDMIIKRGLNTANREIDYGDMVWLPCVVQGMTPARYPWIFVDEAQDLTAAQRTLAIMACQENGRMLFVGDRCQSIFGFAGADTNSVDKIIQETGAVSLPLSICYRCPTSHLDIARTIVSHIENAPGAIVGTVDTIHVEDLHQHAGEGDLILCRLTAPLISAAYRLIREGIPARVIGRDIGAGILRLLDLVWKDQSLSSFADLAEGVDDYRYEQVTLILAENDGDEEDPRIESLCDRCDCLGIIMRCSAATSLRELEDAINKLFNDQVGTVDLSTVHRAKGLEASSVYILRYELMPSPYAAPGWPQLQEEYLRYVAHTRSRRALTYIVV